METSGSNIERINLIHRTFCIYFFPNFIVVFASLIISIVNAKEYYQHRYFKHLRFNIEFSTIIHDDHSFSFIFMILLGNELYMYRKKEKKSNVWLNLLERPSHTGSILIVVGARFLKLIFKFLTEMQRRRNVVSTLKWIQWRRSWRRCTVADNSLLYVIDYL